MSLVFVVDYPTRWPSFITDLLSTLSLGPHAVQLYLRTLIAIDTEVGIHTVTRMEISTYNTVHVGLTNCEGWGSEPVPQKGTPERGRGINFVDG